MKKYYIITLLILLSCNVLAQEDYSFSVQKNRPVETVEPDVLSAQPYNEQSSDKSHHTADLFNKDGFRRSSVKTIKLSKEN